MNARRVLAIGVALAALAGAGVGGAVVEGIVVTIKDGEWARLGPTDVYCEAFYEAKYRRDAFDCAVWNGSHRVGNSYSAIIDDLGVEVDRWDTAGRSYHKVITYVNP